MGLQPQDALAFEDSANGFQASSGAGLKTIVTVNDYTRDHNFNGAALVIDQLGEPAAPFKILKGRTFRASLVDVDLLREIHADK